MVLQNAPLLMNLCKILFHRVQHREHLLFPIQATDPGGTITMVTTSGRSFTIPIKTVNTAIQETNPAIPGQLVVGTISIPVNWWLITSIGHLHTHTHICTLQLLMCTVHTIQCKRPVITCKCYDNCVQLLTNGVLKGCMLQTKCKLDLFANGPLVYKLIIQFLKWLACFQLYKANWSHLETRLNGFKAGRMVWKLGEWFVSSLNGMKAV